MDIDVTPALRQAALLFAVAQHLTRNSHLPPVNICGNDLQLRHPEHPAAELLAWTDSLTDPRATVQAIDGKAYVEVVNSLPPCAVTVWTTVPGLAEVLGLDHKASPVPLDLDVLRQFAASSSDEAA